MNTQPPSRFRRNARPVFRPGGVRAVAMLLVLVCASLPAATSLTQNGVTWTFDSDRETGVFCTGEPWVLGPVRIVAISNDLHALGFAPKPGQDGSMVDPGADPRQGYDASLASYDPALNAGMPGGRPLSAGNPLELRPGQTLVSMVSWLYRSASDREPGCPAFNGGTKAPRPVTRAAAVLTCLGGSPPEGSFRPPYCGPSKAVRFHPDRLRTGLLPRLRPVGRLPSVQATERALARTWIDHVNGYLGAMVHPSEHMPNYGRDMAHEMNAAALLVLIDFEALPGKPDKRPLLIRLVQYGIDLAGIADCGGGWPANGGHAMGRKWPILFAGLMLDDPHMKSVGGWTTRFQEDEQTFIVTERDVEVTNGPRWAPDRRSPANPYAREHIGMPEWGIRHASEPQADNRELSAMYRGINGSVYPGFVLAATLLGQRAAWNHEPLFAYTERYMALVFEGRSPLAPPAYVCELWRREYGPAPRR